VNCTDYDDYAWSPVRAVESFNDKASAMGEIVQYIVVVRVNRKYEGPLETSIIGRTRMNRKQLTILLILLVVDALSAFLTYTFFVDQLAAVAGVPMPDLGVPDSVLGLASAGIVLVVYGLLGLAGYWFARKLGLPGIYREKGSWRGWFFIPLGLGLVSGVLLVLGDVLFAPINGFGRLAHPGFPVSILASISAGIGEEIAFRVFLFGLWGLILTWAFKRFNGRTAALWIANLIAALAFGAGHLGTIMALTGATSLSSLSPILLAEIFLLNGVIGLVAGERYMKDGLVAAAGVQNVVSDFEECFRANNIKAEKGTPLLPHDCIRKAIATGIFIGAGRKIPCEKKATEATNLPLNKIADTYQRISGGAMSWDAIILNGGGSGLLHKWMVANFEP
jgi:hypothetical protein